jgi:hypothetical protein
VAGFIVYVVLAKAGLQPRVVADAVPGGRQNRATKV